MREIIVISMISLDGVMQAPGGPEEDTSGGFTHGGWTFPYFDDFANKIVTEQMVDHPYDLLLGKKTYDIWKDYWPKHTDNPIGAAFERATKYVASETSFEPTWDKTIVFSDNVVEQVKKLKEGAPPFDEAQGKEIQVQGSANLIQTLLKNDLVDQIWLKIFPITLGPGKRLFDGGQIPAAFTLLSSSHSPSGVIFANYKRAGEIQTGNFGG